jgi:hypothetical protein
MAADISAQEGPGSEWTLGPISLLLHRLLLICTMCVIAKENRREIEILL